MLVVRSYVVDAYSGVSRKSGKAFRRVVLSGSLYWLDGDGGSAQKVLRVGDLESFLPDDVDDLHEGDLVQVPVNLTFDRGGKVAGQYVQPSFQVRLDWRRMQVLDEVDVYAGA